jgi:hypothetical protein
MRLPGRVFRLTGKLRGVRKKQKQALAVRLLKRQRNATGNGGWRFAFTGETLIC